MKRNSLFLISRWLAVCPNNISCFLQCFFFDWKCPFYHTLKYHLNFGFTTSIPWFVHRCTVLHVSNCAALMLFLKWYISLVEPHSLFYYSDCFTAVYFCINARIPLSGLGMSCIFYYHIIVWTKVRKMI